MTHFTIRNVPERGTRALREEANEPGKTLDTGQ